MAITLHSNNALAFLLNPVSVGATSIVLQPGQGALFPAIGVDENFYVTVEDRALGLREIMLCTARNTDSLTVVRAQQGTPATAFDAGTSVSNRVTAGFLNSFAGDIATALTNSQAASVAAATALATATDAKNTADSLSDEITGAAALATEAMAKATQASDDAAAATTAAGEALDTANAAQTTADGVAGTADNALAVADQAQQDASDALAAAEAIQASLVDYALLDSPSFVGEPNVPTAAPGDNTVKIANTIFVNQAIASALSGSTLFLPITGGELAGPGNLKVNGTLLVGDSATFQKGFASTDPTANNYMAGMLTVAGAAQLTGAVQINGMLTGYGGANLSGGVDVTGGLNVSQGATVGGGITVSSGGASIYGDLQVDGGGIRFIGGPQTISFLKSGADTVTVRVTGDSIQFGNTAWSLHTMLGVWEASADPTTALGLATKQYVDAQLTLAEVLVSGTGVKAITVSKNTRNVYITPVGGNIQIGTISGLVVGQSIMVFMKQDTTDRTLTLDASSNAVLATADALNMVSGSGKRAYAILTGGRKSDGSVEPTFFKMTGPA